MPDIIDDPDVRQIFSSGPQPALKISQLGPADEALARTFFGSHANVFNSGFALAACLTDLANGVRAVDGFSAQAPIGWKKFIVFEMAKPLDQLHYEHRRETESLAYAEWMLSTIEDNRWHIDKNDDLTALNDRRQECMSMWAKGGMRRDPATGAYLAASPEHARRLAQ